MYFVKKNSVVFEAQILRWMTKHILMGLTLSVQFSMWACSCEQSALLRGDTGGDSNLRVCCDFALMFPALA